MEGVGPDRQSWIGSERQVMVSHGMELLGTAVEERLGPFSHGSATSGMERQSRSVEECLVQERLGASRQSWNV